MLSSQIMLECDFCSSVFEQHRWAEGEEPTGWIEAVNLLLETADKDGWSVRRRTEFHICPDCGLDGVCPG